MDEAARIAVREHNPALAARIADYLRLKIGMNWEQSWQLVNKWTGVSKARWDALLYEADEGFD